MGTPTNAMLRTAEGLLKLGATGVVFVLLAGGVLGGGYLLIDRVVEGLEAVVEEEQAVEVSIVELKNAIERSDDRADARFERWIEANDRREANMVRLLRGIAAVSHSTCRNTSNGSVESSRACDRALTESQ